MKKVMVFGTFDLLHPGHVNFFEQAKSYGDTLIVVVARDSTVSKVKSHTPHDDEKTRVSNIEQLNIADKIVLGSTGEDKYEIVRYEKPDVVALGYDQQHFIGDLENALEDHVKIVRLSPYRPDLYKSSLLARQQNKVE